MHIYAVTFSAAMGHLYPFVKLFHSRKLREEIETNIESWLYDRGMNPADVKITYLGREF